MTGMIADAVTACSALVYRLYYALDEHAYQGLDQLLSPDVRFTRLGNTVEGLSALTAVFSQRPATMATRHVLSNPMVSVTGPDAASGIHYMQVVRKHNVTPATPRPLLVRSAWRLSIVHTTFARAASGWRIDSLRTEPGFEFVADGALPAEDTR